MLLDESASFGNRERDRRERGATAASQYVDKASVVSLAKHDSMVLPKTRTKNSITGNDSITCLLLIIL